MKETPEELRLRAQSCRELAGRLATDPKVLLDLSAELEAQAAALEPDGEPSE